MPREVSEETFVALEILQPMCGLRYGTTNAVGTCAAALGTTGTHKCHNTRFTCQDPAAYNATDTAVIRFVRAQELPLSYGPFIPALRSMSIAPGSINFAGMERAVSAFGQREEVTAVLADCLHSGHQLDPYRLERQTGDASLLDSGDAQAGGADTLTLEATAPESFAGTPIVRLVAGAGSVQERPLLSFDGTTKVARVSPAWDSYLNVPITPGAGATTPDSVANSITGDIDIRVKAQLADWTVTGSLRTRLVWKRSATVAYDFYIDADTLGFYNGSTHPATVALPFADDSINWVRMTRTAADGVVKFYTSEDGVTWTQLGADRVGPSGALNDTTDTLRLAGDGALNSINGKLFYAEIRSGIDGTVAVKFDPKEADADASFVSSTGETWSIVGGASLLRLPDATTDYQIRDAFDPYERGTLLGKWIARNPFYGNFRARVRMGRVGQALEDMRVRHYVVANIAGPNESGQATIKLRDLFSKVEARKAVFPLPSTGKLSAAITGSPGSFTVTPAGIGNTAENEGGYANLTSGWVRIGGECIQVTRSGDVFTVVARGALGTEASDHDADDLVQAVGALAAEKPHEHIYTLLTGYSAIPAANIDKADWDTQMADYQHTYLSYITEPTAVEKLVGEIEEQAGLSIWHDPGTDEVKMRRLRPEGADPTVNDDGWIMRGTLSPTRQEAKRASRVLVYFGIRNYTAGLEDPNNYQQGVLVPSLESEGPDQYGSLSLRKIFSRWIVVGGLQSATDTGTRVASIFQDPPREVTLQLFASRAGELEIAKPFTLVSNLIQDADTGLPLPVPMVPIKLFEDEHAISVHGQELKFAIDLGDPNVRNVYITTRVNNVNLRTMHDQLFTPLTGVETVNFYIQSAGEVGSLSTGSFACDSGDWSDVPTVAVNVYVEGRIQAKGGNGGRGSAPGIPSTAGGAGGPSLKVRSPINLFGAGKIFSGAGGGGGAGGAGGGGGAGKDPGSGGDGQSPGAAGTADAGGSGGSWSGNNAGAGGGPGLAGGAGTGGDGKAGGAAGVAIDGVSLVTFDSPNLLDIRGAQIN